MSDPNDLCRAEVLVWLWICLIFVMLGAAFAPSPFLRLPMAIGVAVICRLIVGVSR